jgi:hypothetical protein
VFLLDWLFFLFLVLWQNGQHDVWKDGGEVHNLKKTDVEIVELN